MENYMKSLKRGRGGHLPADFYNGININYHLFKKNAFIFEFPNDTSYRKPF